MYYFMNTRLEPSLIFIFIDLLQYTSLLSYTLSYKKMNSIRVRPLMLFFLFFSKTFLQTKSCQVDFVNAIK